MHIKKVKIENYRVFRNFSIEFNSDLNIIVGNNETGKSTLLEAINLALTAQLNGHGIMSELSPYLFNTTCIRDYLENLKVNPRTPLPLIQIEVFLGADPSDETELAQFQGTNNSERKNCSGICFRIEFNNSFEDVYSSYIETPEDVLTIPIEYYTFSWYSFSGNAFQFAQLPAKVMLLDRADYRLQGGNDRYIAKIISSSLEKKENAQLALQYRKLKEDFANHESIKSVNERIESSVADTTSRLITVSVDVSARSNWDSNLTIYVDEIPFKFIGRGEQGALKTKLSLKTKIDSVQMVLIEEPETSLSYSNLSNLVDCILSVCCEKQLIITTHSTFLVNRSGIDKVIFLNNQEAYPVREISQETRDYFKKLPNFDTLRFIIAKKPILVEGPSEVLVIQKVYHQQYGHYPLVDGVDIIAVGGLTFKRYMEIAKAMKKKTIIITDNDGEYIDVQKRYAEFESEYAMLLVDKNDSLPTFEPQLVAVNGLAKLNHVFHKDFSTEESLIKYMIRHKTDCALQIYMSQETIELPGYMTYAIQK